MPQTKIIKNQLTLPEFEELHSLVDTTYARTIEIKVPRATLWRLNADNRTMRGKLPPNHATARPVTKGLMYPQGSSDLVDAAIANAPRKNSKLVAIDKKIVLHMLIDHSVLIGKLEDIGYEVND